VAAALLLASPALARSGEALGVDSIDERLALGAAQQESGAYSDAAQSYLEALAAARSARDRPRTARALGALGDVHLALGPLSEAESHLDQALAIAHSLDDPAVAGPILVALGNLRSLQERPLEALGAYLEAAEIAAATGRSPLRARALASAARAAQAAGDPVRAEGLAGEATAAVRAIPMPERATLLIHIARTQQLLAPERPGADPPLLLRAHDLLRDAEAVALEVGDARSASYAAGYLGGLYEAEGRQAEALVLTRRAVAQAQQTGARDPLYLWEWQTGRLLAAQGERSQAIAAYERAIESIEALRFDLPVRYGTPDTSFREKVGAAYIERVDLLLQQAAEVSDPASAEPLLRTARDTLESLRAAELRDYFQDECVDALQAKLKSVDEASLTALVVYPVILPDRVELLLTLPGGSLARTSAPVAAAELDAELRRFRSLLRKRSTRQYLRPARRLYDWLVRPYEARLEGIDTLVFVPDGALLTVPPAAFHDGERFLVERFAVAITPGLELTDPTPWDSDALRPLLAGLTKSVEGFPPLVQTERELRELHAAYGGLLMIDESFRVEAVREKARVEPVSIVHIATHGEFREEADESFLLAWDGRISMDDLEELVARFRFRDTPLELLTLSACETAQGSDRAALGLSGIAIKAGARSVLGTLWRVNDQAAAELVLEFYRQLGQQGVSRGEALRIAQRLLIGDPTYRHPAYWSPFVLISSWL
jgi:CHAT domain-containing protein